MDGGEGRLERRRNRRRRGRGGDVRKGLEQYRALMYVRTQRETTMVTTMAALPTRRGSCRPLGCFMVTAAPHPLLRPLDLEARRAAVATVERVLMEGRPMPGGIGLARVRRWRPRGGQRNQKRVWWVVDARPMVRGCGRGVSRSRGGEDAKPMGPACHGNHYGKQATLQSLQPTRRPQPSVLPTHPSDPSANER